MSRISRWWLVLPLALPLAPPVALAQDDIRSERVQFERGAEAAIVEGSITGYERYEIPDAVEVAAAAVCASRNARDFPG